MPNKQYQKGVRLEREIVNMIKEAGGQATRTAGSHGWIDVVGRNAFSSEVDLAETLVGFDMSTETQPGFPCVFERVTKKYCDVLYIQVYADDISQVFLIQCKRKKVKHG